MAGYFMYSLDGRAFQQLTNNPTDEQVAIIANRLADVDFGSEQFPKETAALTAAIKARLVSDDWYASLNQSDAAIWDDFVFALRGNFGEQLGIGFECSDYESIYWDCADACVEQGVKMLEEPTFGSSGFRFHGELSHDYGHHRTYSIFDPATVRQLAEQLSAVQSYFNSLPEDEEVKEEFFDGLLASVLDSAKRGRYLFVITDT